MRATGYFLVFVGVLAGCASPGMGGSEKVQFGGSDAGGEDAGQISQAELQEDLQRFTSQLIERISQAAEPLVQSGPRSTRESALKRLLRYASSALDIASGPYPEVNLLDMLVFVRLNRQALEEYWMPEVYGPPAKGLLTAFRLSERAMIKTASKVLSLAQQGELNRLAEEWRKENPGQHYVEWVRLTDFSRKAGQLESVRAEKASGLLSSVKRAVGSADQALLLANRAMYLGQRMPFLLRMQARIGAQELLSDSMGQLEQAGKLAQGVNPLVKDMESIVSSLGQMMGQAGPLMTEFRRNFPRDPNSTVAKKLMLGERLSGNLLQLVSRLQGVSAGDAEKAIQAARAQIDGLVWTIALAMLLVGAGWAFVGWGGYYLVRKRRDRKSRLAFEKERVSSRRPPSSGAAA